MITIKLLNQQNVFLRTLHFEIVKPEDMICKIESQSE